MIQPPRHIKADMEGHYYTNRLRLSFVGDLEHRYRRYCTRRDRRYLANLAVLVVAIYLLYGMFDWYLLTDTLDSVWRVRYLVGLPVLLGVLISIRSLSLDSYLQKVIVFVLTWISACTLYMVVIVPDEIKGMYMASELVIAMAGLTVTRLRFWDSVVAVVLFISVVVYFLAPVGDMQRINSYYICLCLGASLICLLAQYSADRSSRREFLQKQLIHSKHRELEKLNQKLKGLAEEDSLSGIANRRHFDQVLDEEWRRARRRGYSLAMLMSDIDFFKSYNDSLGHQKGDECIKQVARSMSETLRRPGDLVARYGGEEFAIILPALETSEAFRVAEVLRANVEAMNIPHPNSAVSAHVTVSVGVAACIPDGYGSKMDLVGWADEALYKAKKSGRNRVECF